MGAYVLLLRSTEGISVAKIMFVGVFCVKMRSGVWNSALWKNYKTKKKLIAPQCAETRMWEMLEIADPNRKHCACNWYLDSQNSLPCQHDVWHNTAFGGWSVTFVSTETRNRPERHFVRGYRIRIHAFQILAQMGFGVARGRILGFKVVVIVTLYGASA